MQKRRDWTLFLDMNCSSIKEYMRGHTLLIFPMMKIAFDQTSYPMETWHEDFYRDSFYIWKPKRKA